MTHATSRAASPARAYCYRCFKPGALCVCGGCVVRNRTRVVILQHPRERQHPIGTERFARLGLRDCAVHIAWDRALPPTVVGPGAALLYPSDEAREVTELSAASRPSTLIAIDGTWSQARSLYKHNPWLAALPHLKLSRAPPSNYRIRREPRVDYVSTIEAIVHALRALEPETEGLETLLERFDLMVDRQLTYVARPPAGSYRHKARGRSTLLPDWRLLDPSRSAVVGYTEYVAPRGTDTEAVVQVCLERIGDGTRLECFVRPSVVAPDATHLANMGLTQAQLDSGVSVSELALRLGELVRASDVLVGWSPSTLRLLGGLASWSDTLSLKTAYANFTRSRPGELDGLPSRHGLELGDSHFSGRAGVRMARAAVMTRWLQTSPIPSRRTS